jgi:hypothetical protein
MTTPTTLYEYQKRRRDRLKAEGTCVDCGQKPAVRKSRCEEHAAKHDTLVKARRLRLLAEGICTGCGREPSRETCEWCDRCFARQQGGYRRRYRARLKSGLCVECGKGPPEGGRLRCQGCLKKHRDLAKKYPEKYQHDRAVRKLRYEQSVEAGKCPLCGEEAADGAVYCDWHAAYDRGRARRMIRRRMGEGQCIRCGGPAVTSTRCQVCRDYVNAKAREATARKRAGKNGA